MGVKLAVALPFVHTRSLDKILEIATPFFRQKNRDIGLDNQNMIDKNDESDINEYRLSC